MKKSKIRNQLLALLYVYGFKKNIAAKQWHELVNNNVVIFIHKQCNKLLSIRIHITNGTDIYNARTYDLALNKQSFNNILKHLKIAGQ